MAAMHLTTASRFLRAVFLAALLLLGGTASGMDLSSCYDDAPPPEDPIRCLLWRLVGYMRPIGADVSLRGTGRVVLGPGLYAQAEVRTEAVNSPWPEAIEIRFFRGEVTGGVSEEIRDRGLDGLKMEDVQDAYLRYSTPERPANLLSNLDPDLVGPINQDYRKRVQQMLEVLERRPTVHSPLAWREIRPGLETARVTAYRYIRLGENTLTLLRIDPARLRIVPFSRMEFEDRTLLNIEAWADRVPEAAALFNAGQYYPDYRYMGLLEKDGVSYGTDLHPTWRALFVSSPRNQASGQPPAAILDLERVRFDPRNNPYRYACQSFMLLDEDGRPRVRRSDRLASRTILAQDKLGRILVVMVQGAGTLYELALLLRQSDLSISQAMCLDGGFESQMFLRLDPGPRALYGGWVVNERRQFQSSTLKVALPAVMAVLPVSRP